MVLPLLIYGGLAATGIFATKSVLTEYQDTKQEEIKAEQARIELQRQTMNSTLSTRDKVTQTAGTMDDLWYTLSEYKYIIGAAVVAVIVFVYMKSRK